MRSSHPVGQLANERTRAQAGSRGRPTPARTCAERVVDERAQAQAGAALLEGDLRLAHRDGPGVRDRERVVDPRPRRRLPGERDERRALGLPQVAARVAAGLLGRAERADEVVDELERETEAAAFRVERGDRLVATRRRAAAPAHSGALNEYTAVLLNVASKIASASA